MMRFTIEERHLTDTDGRPVATTAPDSVAFRNVDADTIDDAVRLYIRDDAVDNDAQRLALSLIKH